MELDQTLTNMRPEDMFPTSPDDASGAGAGMRDPGDHRPNWLYRATEELSIADVRRIFLPSPHEALKKVLDFCSNERGEAGLKHMHVGTRGVPPVTPRTGLRGWVTRKACSFLDLVTRESSDRAAEVLRDEYNVFVLKERYVTRQNFSDEVHAKAKEILDAISPRIDAQAHEGKSFSGRRMIAVWSGLKEPEADDAPEF